MGHLPPPILITHWCQSSLVGGAYCVGKIEATVKELNNHRILARENQER